MAKRKRKVRRHYVLDLVEREVAFGPGTLDECQAEVDELGYGAIVKEGNALLKGMKPL